MQKIEHGSFSFGDMLEVFTVSESGELDLSVETLEKVLGTRETEKLAFEVEKTMRKSVFTKTAITCFKMMLQKTSLVPQNHKIVSFKMRYV